MAHIIRSIGRKCEKCNADAWVVSENKGYYHEICTSCWDIIEIRKQDFVDNFECEKCGCLECSLEENKHKIATRCKNCGSQTIVLEKHEMSDTDNNIRFCDRSNDENIPKCPTCQSTNIGSISTTKRFFKSMLFGLSSDSIGKSMQCKNCGYKW